MGGWGQRKNDRKGSQSLGKSRLYVGEDIPGFEVGASVVKGKKRGGIKG